MTDEKHYIEVYKSAANSKYRWRKRRWGNHEKVATSGEDFESRRNAIVAAFSANEGTPVFEITDGGSIELLRSDYVKEETPE